jgi:hypothetical protein
VTDESQSPSPADEPVTEQPTVVTPGTSAPMPPPPAAGSPPPAPVHTAPPVPPPVPPVVETGPQPAPSLSDKVTALIDQRPEIGAGGAFAGGIVFALILKRIAR